MLQTRLLSRFAALGPLLALAAALLSSGGCARQEGAVELDWSIVDGNFEDLFPGQHYSSSCALKSLARQSASSDPSNPRYFSVDLNLQVRLTVYRCPDTLSVEECEQSKPVSRKEFSCDHMRGTIGGLPSTEESYLFVVDPLLTVGNSPAFVPAQRCVATPGARRRRIRAGQITNLAVYQIVVQATNTRPMTVNECVTPPSSNSTAVTSTNPTQ